MRPNKRILIKGGLLVLVAFTAREYAHYTFMGPLRAQAIVEHLESRPYVYRVLVPWLAELLVWLGLGPVQALTLLVILSAIGLVYGIKYLLASVRS